jgi:hypothetical protein
MNHDTIMQLARDAAGGMLSHDAEGFCSLTGPEIVRFAELLVKKCIKVIDDSTPLYSAEDQQEDFCQGKLNGYQEAILGVKEHFGVE